MSGEASVTMLNESLYLRERWGHALSGGEQVRHDLLGERCATSLDLSVNQLTPDVATQNKDVTPKREGVLDRVGRGGGTHPTVDSYNVY